MFLAEDSVADMMEIDGEDYALYVAQSNAAESTNKDCIEPCDQGKMTYPEGQDGYDYDNDPRFVHFVHTIPPPKRRPGVRRDSIKFDAELLKARMLIGKKPIPYKDVEETRDGGSDSFDALICNMD